MFVKSNDITKLLVSVGAKPKSNVNVELNVTVKMEYVPLHVAFPPPNICHHTDSGASSQDVSMIAEPISLQAMCINIICFTHKKMKGYELNLGNFRLPVSLSADLLFAMVKYRLLSDESIRMFNSKHTNLTSVALHDVMLSIEGLEVLRQHRLTELTLNNVGIYLEDAISNRVINSSTSKSLRSLSLYNFRMEEDYMQRTVMTDLARRFTNLVHLSLVSVRLENDGLSSLCSVLTPIVTHLDISRNFVTDISPLTKFSASLKFLNMYNLYSVKESNAKILMFELKELLHLNISCESGHQLEAFLNEGVTPLSIEKMLLTPGGLAKLQSVDLSGREHITEDVVKEFLNLHPKISFVGLLLTPAANIQDADEPWYGDSVTISSLATEKLIKESLRRYGDRFFYVQKSLVALFQLTRETVDHHPGTVPLIVETMSKNIDHVTVQMASTACLYNLTREESGTRIHPDSMRLAVHHILESMAKYPSNEQLQRNCLLILCTDKMLVEVNFDKYRCAKLVMECLCKFEDTSIVRMVLAIVSILAARITTEQTSSLASNRQYMTRLLEITRDKLMQRSTDCIMKFALSALWNLTDESPVACQTFTELDGISLVMDCLNKYEDIDDAEAKVQIQTKVVGLLNNIAEVKELREMLITRRFIDTMRNSLKSDSSEQRYFSGGILANLLSDSTNAAWDDLVAEYRSTESEVITAISHWYHPETAMVAYRCFRPFIPLLNSFTSLASQYWALWAVHHVCTKDPTKYVPMLTRDGVYECIVRLSMQSEDTSCSQVLELARNLHDFVSDFQNGSLNDQNLLPTTIETK